MNLRFLHTGKEFTNLASNTKRNYRERYRVNIQPVIGSMRLCDVKPMHCKIVLNRMEVSYDGAPQKMVRNWCGGYPLNPKHSRE